MTILVVGTSTDTGTITDIYTDTVTNTDTGIEDGCPGPWYALAICYDEWNMS